MIHSDSSSPQTNRNASKKNDYHLVTYQEMLPFYTISSPSHYMLRFDILFFSLLLPAAIVIFIRGQQ